MQPTPTILKENEFEYVPPFTMCALNKAVKTNRGIIIPLVSILFKRTPVEKGEFSTSHTRKQMQV